MPDDAREVVLDARQDDFYASHLYANYGDIGASVKGLVEAFTAKSEKHQQARCGWGGGGALRRVVVGRRREGECGGAAGRCSGWRWRGEGGEEMPRFVALCMA